MNKKISIVVSVYNEEAVLRQFYAEINKVLRMCSWQYEVLFVNDGSRDKSYEILSDIALEDENVKVINFSRNFGHEAAMLAGIDHSTGDGVVCMDADLQHPVTLIPEIIQKMEEGYEVVSMVRTQNKTAGLIKNITSSAFYKVLNIMSAVQFEENASDFFAMTSKPAGIIKSEYREKVRFLRGYVQSLGFRKTTIEYEARERAAGESKYNIKKLINFSINALLGFSNLPLKAAGICGLISGLLGVIVMVYTIYTKVMSGTPAGYATIISVLCFMFSILFVLIGIIGEYLGIIFMEIKDRPIYIIAEKKNF